MRSGGRFPSQSAIGYIRRNRSALDEIHDKYGFNAKAIVTMAEVIEYLYNKEYNGKIIIDDTLKAAIDAYYEIYGVK